MNDIVISVDNISKMYPLYAKPSDRLKQSLWYGLPWFLRGVPRQFYREFWALRDISFTVNKGETVGIIGRNGCGKSTLLQIIAGTLTPSHGEVMVNGRVAALLELGSGFNPEFSGRENVFMNGSILGLSNAEIETIYDKIVAFADIGQFIDQPVKFYSSGMFVRLAFAVQAFVPKEVLVVDEALSVGDEAFQRKCMVLLEKFRQDGGTVLLVSHDSQTIIRQCKRAILLFQGELLLDGPSKFVTDSYQKIMNQPTDFGLGILDFGLEENAQSKIQNLKSKIEIIQNPIDWFDPNMPHPNETSYSNGIAEITDCGMINLQGERVNVLVTGQRYEWVYRVRFDEAAHDVTFGMMLKTIDGLDVAGVVTRRENMSFDHIAAKVVMEVRFSIKLNVVPGTYFLNSGVTAVCNNQHIYLHRRVDIEMIRVQPCDSRHPYGLAYLEPQITVKELELKQQFSFWKTLGFNHR